MQKHTDDGNKKRSIDEKSLIVEKTVVCSDGDPLAL
jgi:hypothetical protein